MLYRKLNAVYSETHKHTLRGHNVVFVNVETGSMLSGVVNSWSHNYEGRLISNAHSEISRKRNHVFKQMKVGSKVQYFSYKLIYLFFDIVALSFNTFSPM